MAERLSFNPVVTAAAAPISTTTRPATKTVVEVLAAGVSMMLSADTAWLLNDGDKRARSRWRTVRALVLKSRS